MESSDGAIRGGASRIAPGALFGIDCQPCDEDPTCETCLTVEMDSGTANAAELAADLQTITADDVAATAECQ